MKIKQIMIIYDNGTVKGYSLRAFVAVFKNKLQVYLGSV